MAFLVPDRIRTETIADEKIVIKEKIIPDSAVAPKKVAYYLDKGKPMKPCKLLNFGTGKPSGITVHNTELIQCSKETTPAEQYCRATYPNGNMGGILVHFYVYKEEIWQMLSENEVGVHAGNEFRKDRRGNNSSGNFDTISIECIGGDKLTEATAAKLVANLCKRHNLDPKKDVYTHNYWMHGVDEMVTGAKKNCPIYIIKHWSSFIDEVSRLFRLDVSYTDKNAKISAGDVVKLISKVELNAGSFEVIGVSTGKLTIAVEIKADNAVKIDSEIRVGDTVKVLNAETYTGGKFKTYYEEYDVLGVDGDRVVIGIGKVVVAPVRATNLRKV